MSDSAASVATLHARHLEALVRAGEIGQVRDAAEDFLHRYPYSGYCEHLETLTGVHRGQPSPNSFSSRN
jgi:hypothetical protein